MITTVLGPVDNLDDGVVDAHAHVWIDAVEGGDPSKTFILDDAPAITTELTTFSGLGGAAVVDCQPPLAGRNLSRLAAVSQASGVAIIASSGFHMPQYYGSNPTVWELDEVKASSYFETDLDLGDGSGVRPGILKAAFPGDVNDNRFRSLISAVCHVSLRTGTAVQIHTERGEGVEGLAAALEEYLLPASRVILSHMDKRPDLGLHLELAQRGFLLEYDTFLRPKYNPELNVWPLVENMLEAGMVGSIACGLDLADPLMWRFSGSPVGMPGLLTVVDARLCDLGADEVTRRALLRDNVCERLFRAGLDSA